MQSDVGEWRLRLGLFKTHPITVADICALTFLLGLGRKGRWVFLAQGLALCCTVATVSRGSIVTLAAILMVRFLWLSPPRTSVPVVGVLLVAIATAFIAGYRADDVARFLPRPITAAYQASADDPELDGRVPLWAYATTIMNDHLPFGFGFDGARMKLMNRFEWAGHSHNSFLETWLISVARLDSSPSWPAGSSLSSGIQDNRPVACFCPFTHIWPSPHSSALPPQETPGQVLLLLALAAMAPRAQSGVRTGAKRRDEKPRVLPSRRCNPRPRAVAKCLPGFGLAIMRILQIHNTYREPGGEDVVADAEAGILQAAGHEVMAMSGRNDGSPFTMIRTLYQSDLWSESSFRHAAEICRAFNPDVAHVHNFWMSLSPSVHAACHQQGVPTVQTLHNYRLMCANGVMLS